MKMLKGLINTYSGGAGSLLRDVILGGQDGLVNVLGVVLAVAFATNDAKIVIIAGLAATFAESISMGAVAFTSTEAKSDYEKKEKRKHEENALHSALVVGGSSFIGSFVPLIPFFLFGIQNAIIVSSVASLAFLFLLGGLKARIAGGSWIWSGAKIAAIGGIAALAGFLIGSWLGVVLV